MPRIKLFQDFARGTLTGSHTAAGTTLTASGLTALREITSGNGTVSIVIDPKNAAGNREVVRVTAHTASAGTATITALANNHDDGEEWVVAFLTEDMPQSVDRPWGGNLGLDQEFNRETASTPPTGWAWTNQSTSTYLEHGSIAAIKIPASSSTSLRVITHSLSGYASTWTVTTKLYLLARQLTFSVVGFCLRESATGKLVVASGISMAAVGAGSPTLVVQRYTNATTYGADLSTPISFPSVPTRYLRVTKNSATSYTFSISNDGIEWLDTAAALDPSAAFTTAPDEIGLYVDTGSNTIVVGSCDFWRVR